MIYFCLLAFTALVSASTGGPDNCVLGAFNEHVQRIDSSLSLSPTIIQVGANLAFKNPTDPLRKLYEMNAERRAKVRLVLVEPVPSTAALLRNLTRGYDYVSVHEAAACPNDADKVAFWTINEAAAFFRSVESDSLNEQGAPTAPPRVYSGPQILLAPDRRAVSHCAHNHALEFCHAS